MKQLFLIFCAFICLTPTISTAKDTAPEPIKIGDISSYTAGPVYQVPYKKGWQMAVDEINANGGILGRPLEYISYDDKGDPSEAVRIAQNLVLNENVLLLTGSAFSNIDLALSSYAKRNKVLYVPAVYNSDKFIWQEGHDFAFRTGGPTPYVMNNILAKIAAEKKYTKMGKYQSKL